MTIFKYQPTKLARAVALATFMMLPTVGTMAAQSMDWQPGATERLVSMPAKYMSATIEKDFQKSSLANGLEALDAQVLIQATRMRELNELQNEVSGEQAVEVRHQVLEAKSSYLELMNERLQLNERALEKKADLYQNVLDKLQRKKARAQDPRVANVIANQNAARERLSQSIAQVDQLLAETIPGQPSKYQQQYSENLAKLEDLKKAVENHVANENPIAGGEAMTREEYVRYLLASIDSEKALLDQERLMIGYMAKLVALDAQALEHEISYGEFDEEAEQAKESVRLANTADLFMN